VAPDAAASTIVARLLGFYPAVATQQNDVIRMSKQIGDYAKQVKAEYVNAYVKAGVEKDSAGQAAIVRAVNEWNADARGTGLEISNFVSSANRSLREAGRSAAARYLKSAPTAVKPETQEIMQLMGVELD
jgi:hypothetical protein